MKLGRTGRRNCGRKMWCVEGKVVLFFGQAGDGGQLQRIFSRYSFQAPMDEKKLRNQTNNFCAMTAGTQMRSCSHGQR
jgi:hypothetical protein